MKKKLKLKPLHFAMGTLVIGAFLPTPVKNDYYMIALNRVLINIIVVPGLNFITGLAGRMNLGTTGIFALGAHSSALLTRYTNLASWLGLIAAVIMGILIGRRLGYPSLKVRGIYLPLTTIGFGEVVRLSVSNTPKFTGGAQGIHNIRPYNIGSYQVQSQKETYCLFLVFTAVALLIAWRIAYFKWRRIFKSLRDSVKAVEMSGVDTASCKTGAFTVASTFGIMAGVMYAHYVGYVNPSTFNLNLSTDYVVILMVGGLGSVVGTVFGSAIATTLPEIPRSLNNYYQVVFCSIILLEVIFFPDSWASAVTGLFMEIHQRISGKSYAEGGE